MKNKEVPMRRCVGCMESKPKGELIRIAAYEGEISIDATGRANGRGVYLCPKEECVKKAQKRNSFKRGFRMEISGEQMDRLYEALKQYEKTN
jgi:predicted RNA-binding protein YlxR (DUF448 family)